MNETKAAEDIIKSKTVGYKTPMQDINLLAKYFISHPPDGKKAPTSKEVTGILTEYIKGQFDDYRSLKWQALLEQAARRAKTSPLVDIDSIPVTKKELDTIERIGNKKLEKIAFTCLITAKYFNLRKPSNNGYVNIGYGELFKAARVTGSLYEQALLLNDLKQMGLIKRCRKIDNPNFRVLFIDDTSEVKLKIKDLREPGYQYLEYFGEPFVKCSCCGVLMRKRSNAAKYCKDCKGRTMRTKVIICCDCGKEFAVSSKNNRTCRCTECQKRKDRLVKLSYYRKSLKSD